MAYRVSLAAPAEADAYAAFERIREAAPMHAEKWLSGLFRPFSAWTRFPPAALSFPRQKSLAIAPATYCTANGRVSTESSFISGRTSSMCVLRIWHASRDVITADGVEE